MIYLDPATGLPFPGQTNSGNAADTVTTFDPPDWQARVANAGIPGGGSGLIAVTATVTGKGITDGFAALGGATALVLKYEFKVNRDANEAVTVPAGTFANTCKFRVEFTIKQFQIVGPAASSPLLAILQDTLVSAFAAPTKVTFWTTNAVPFLTPKSVTVITPTGAASVTGTSELTALVKAAR